MKIPKNATNGDVFKIVFPSLKAKTSSASEYDMMVKFPESYAIIAKTWWDAPYTESEVKKMKIGKFKVDIYYDMRCDKCYEYRSNIAWLVPSLTVKPTSEILKLEGWTFKDGKQLCPYCSGKRVRN